MNAPDMTPATLRQLPSAVREKMDEVGLRGTLEDVFERLNSGDIPPDECSDVVELAESTLAVLSTASGPLVQDTYPGQLQLSAS